MAVLAHSLVNLRAEVLRRWPRATVYWVNAKPWIMHENDHAPDPHGIVHAIDVMRVNTDPIVVRDVARRHKGVTRYVIYNRQIFHARVNFAPAPYSGTNPHTDHVHISIEYGSGPENWNGLWGIVGSISGVGTAPPEARVTAVTSGPWDFSPAVFQVAQWFANAAANVESMATALRSHIR